MRLPEELTALIELLNRLPGVGRRSAERMALAILRDRDRLGPRLARALERAAEAVVPCARCGTLTRREENPCRLCTDPARDPALLCVVEDPADIAPIEATGAFRGRYHALMGKISPIRGDGPADLRIQSLMKRVREDKIREVLLALNADTESDATAGFLAEHLAATGVRVSRLARGIPSGSGIAYADALTLRQAIRHRIPADESDNGSPG